MKKRTFKQLRKEILQSLQEGPKSVTQVAKSVDADWRTAKRHLVWLEKMEGKIKKIRGTKKEITYRLSNRNP